jgi:hypothetical protein
MSFAVRKRRKRQYRISGKYTVVFDKKCMKVAQKNNSLSTSTQNM